MKAFGLMIWLMLVPLALAADYDLRITNGRIVDGTGADAFPGSVGVKGGG